MISKRLGGLCAALGLALGLGGCADDYGYGGMSVGYGNAGYYGDPYYDGYGYGGYGYPSNYGWYGDYYYPGAGIYVYDQYRRPYRWNDNQRRYWSNQQRYRGREWNGQGSWNGFDRRDADGRQGRGNDRNRQWQREGYAPGTRGYQGNPGARGDGRTFAPQQQQQPRGEWQRDRSGYAPRARSNGSVSGARGDGRTFTAPQQRGSGQWSGRRGGSGGRAADTRGQPAD